MLLNLESHTSPKLSSSFFIFLIASFFNHPHCFISAHIFIYAGCSQEKYQPNTIFEANLNALLSSVVSSSSRAAYNSFALGNATSGPPDGAVYGLYQCRGDLKIQDCIKCIRGAVNEIPLVCSYSYGAAVQLEGCYVRYEHADFLGKLDTSFRYKKCSSKSVSNDAEFFRRRDDVLAELKGAVGFRVSSSGLVEGFAQCMGDLSSVDCSNCLGEAVEDMKSMCGSAAAADVFLGQCYARYWASGYYDFSPDSNNEDQVGKTVAIIVGVLAALAVLIVLLSICRKTMG